MYRAVVENIFGVRAEIKGLSIKPCLPTSWNKVSMKREYRGAIYNISIKKGKEDYIVVDGEKISSNIIPCFESGSTHNVECFIK